MFLTYGQRWILSLVPTLPTPASFPSAVPNIGVIQQVFKRRGSTKEVHTTNIKIQLEVVWFPFRLAEDVSKINYSFKSPNEFRTQYKSEGSGYSVCLR